jgi:DNA-binding IclR family transcriptional regulator
MLGTVDRAGRVLDLFSGECPEWGASAVARELRVAKSQAHELLVSLAAIGLLQRAESGRYRLGWRIPALGSVYRDTSDLPVGATRAMRVLAGRFGETLQLAVWGDGAAVCVATYESRHGVAVTPSPVGASLPGHCTGAGKVLLASRPADELRNVLERDELARMTPRTIVTGDELRRELATVRRRGYAYERGERSSGTWGVAAPIRSDRGDVVAAVGMAVPACRWAQGEREYTQAMLAAAAGTARGAGPTFGITERTVDTAAPV